MEWRTDRWTLPTHPKPQTDGYFFSVSVKKTDQQVMSFHVSSSFHNWILSAITVTNITTTMFLLWNIRVRLTPLSRRTHSQAPCRKLIHACITIFTTTPQCSFKNIHSPSPTHNRTVKPRHVMKTKCQWQRFHANRKKRERQIQRKTLWSVGYKFRWIVKFRSKTA